jgi:hypothetical protein
VRQLPGGFRRTPWAQWLQLGDRSRLRSRLVLREQTTSGEVQGVVLVSGFGGSVVMNGMEPRPAARCRKSFDEQSRRARMGEVRTGQNRPSVAANPFVRDALVVGCTTSLASRNSSKTSRGLLDGKKSPRPSDARRRQALRSRTRGSRRPREDRASAAAAECASHRVPRRRRLIRRRRARECRRHCRSTTAFRTPLSGTGKIVFSNPPE